MAFKDYLLAVARGGLPEALDTAIGGNRQGDTRPETTDPVGTVQDREPGMQVQQGVGASIAPMLPYLILGGLVIGGVMLLRKG